MIWIDVTNLPHVLFFEDFIKKNDCLVTTREFPGLTELLDKHGIGYIAVGKHGGKGLKEKIHESARRISELIKLISEHDIHVALSKHSVELPRVAFGLGIPCIQVVDNEHAEEQNRLTLPLASKIVVPKFLDKSKIQNQGAVKEKIIEFNGLCEVAHLKHFEPDRAKVKELGLEDYILVRPEPYMAAYFRSAIKTQKLIDELKNIGMNVVVIPRGNEKFEGAISLKNIDSLNLIYPAKVFLGGGGTMTRESALLGTPTISFYPQDLLGADKFLVSKGLVHHSLDLKEILRHINNSLDRKKEFRGMARKLRASLEDPFEVINKEIKKF